MAIRPANCGDEAIDHCIERKKIKKNAEKMALELFDALRKLSKEVDTLEIPELQWVNNKTKKLIEQVLKIN